MRLHPAYYDRSGQPISEAEMACLFVNDAARRVALDEVVCGDESVRVSTVHLVLDHNWGNGPPLIFETMVFGGPSKVDGWQCRYSTEGEAREGHARVYGALRAADLNWFDENP